MKSSLTELELNGAYLGEKLSGKRGRGTDRQRHPQKMELNKVKGF